MQINTIKLRRALETFAKTGKITLTAAALTALALSAPVSANSAPLTVTKDATWTNNGANAEFSNVSNGIAVTNNGNFEFISGENNAVLRFENNTNTGTDCWGSALKSDGRKDPAGTAFPTEYQAVLTLQGTDVDGVKTIQINNNSAWGAAGLNILDTVANVSNASFFGNKVNTYGGALWAGYGANVTLENVTMESGITKNTGSNLRNAHAGGGIWIANGKNWTDPTSVTVNNVTIENMVVYGNEKAPGLGGGIGMEKNTTLNVVGDLAITGTNTNENFSSKTVQGAGIYAGGTMNVKKGATLKLDNNQTSMKGGGLYIANEGDSKVIWPEDSNEIAFYTNGKVNIENGAEVIVSNNKAADGAGIYIEGGEDGKAGGAFTNAGTLTVSGNTAGEFGLSDKNHISVKDGFGGGLNNKGTFTNVSENADGSKTYGSAVFYENLATGGGAGIYNTGTFNFTAKDGASLLMERNATIGNGGAIVSSGTLTLAGEDSNGAKSIQFNYNSAYNNVSGSVGAAGGILINGGTADISNVSFTGNAANTYGGAILVRGGSTVTLTDVVMEGGTINGDTLFNRDPGNYRNAWSGGGLAIRSTKTNGNITDAGTASVTVDGLTIRNMVVYGSNDPTWEGYGGGVAVYHGHTLNVVGDGLTIENTNVNNQNKILLGGGVSISGLADDNAFPSGKVNVTAGSSMNLLNNHAQIGGGIYVGGACTDQANPKTTGFGGSDNAILTVNGTLNAIGNSATANGGGIYNAGTITNVGENGTYGNMIIRGNKANGGAGVFNTGTFEFISKNGATLLVEGNSAANWGSGITSKGDSASLILQGAENADGSKTIQFNYNHTSGDDGAGGLNLYSGKADISNVSFTGNAVNTYGGAIWAGYGAEVTLTDVVMDGGTLNKETLPNWKNTGYFRNACYGGGLYMRDANVTVDGLTITNMVIFGEDEKNDIFAAGGGIHIGHEDAELHIVGDGLTISGTNSNLNKTATVWGAGMNVGGKVFVESTALIENNRTERDGGGIYVASQEEHQGYVSQGSLTVEKDGTLTLAGNTANRGGALFVEGSTQTAGSFTNNGTLIVTGNTAEYGGGIYAANKLTLGGTGIFSGNKATILGAGDDIYAGGNLTFVNGANYSFDGGIVSYSMTLQNGAEVALKSGSESTVNRALVNDGTMKFELDPGESEFGTIKTGSYSGSGKVAVGINGFTTIPADKQTQTIVSGADASGNVEANTGLITVKGENGNTTVTIKETGKVGDNYGNVAATADGLAIFQKDDKGNYVTDKDGHYVLAGGGEMVHDFSFIVDGANSEINLQEFANWLGTETGLETAVGTGYVSVRLETPFEIMSNDRFVWDFSGFQNGIANLQFASVNMMDNTVPEPTTWALLVLGGLGVFGVVRKNRKAKK